MTPVSKRNTAGRWAAHSNHHAFLSSCYEAQSLRYTAGCSLPFVFCFSESCPHVCLSPRMHPSEVWARRHGQRGDEGGGSGPQEVSTICPAMSFPLSAAQPNHSRRFSFPRLAGWPRGGCRSPGPMEE